MALSTFSSEYEGFDGAEDDDEPRAGWPNAACVICGKAIEFEGFLMCPDCEAAIVRSAVRPVSLPGESDPAIQPY